jgi:hypothetical protein
MPRKKAEDKYPSKKVIKKPKLSQNKSLIAFYRYQLISLCSVISKKDDYMASLRIKKTDAVSVPLSNS